MNAPTRMKVRKQRTLISLTYIREKINLPHEYQRYLSRYRTVCICMYILQLTHDLIRVTTRVADASKQKKSFSIYTLITYPHFRLPRIYLQQHKKNQPLLCVKLVIHLSSSRAKLFFVYISIKASEFCPSKVSLRAHI